MQIYAVQNLLTGEVYVGQTSMSLRRRLQSHVDNARTAVRANKQPTDVGHALLTYGREAFHSVVLETCGSKDDADRAELAWADHLLSYAPYGYNRRECGRHGRLSARAKRLISASPRTNETRRKIGQKVRGRPLTLKQREALTRGRAALNQRPRFDISGERNGRARLSPRKVKEIRDLYATKQYSQRALGEMYGVAQTTIAKVVHRRSWGTS